MGLFEFFGGNEDTIINAINDYAATRSYNNSQQNYRQQYQPNSYHHEEKNLHGGRSNFCLKNFMGC